MSFTHLLGDGGLREFLTEEDESAGQQGGKEKNRLHDLRGERLQWDTKQSQRQDR